MDQNTNIYKSIVILFIFNSFLTPRFSKKRNNFSLHVISQTLLTRCASQDEHLQQKSSIEDNSGWSVLNILVIFSATCNLTDLVSFLMLLSRQRKGTFSFRPSIYVRYEKMRLIPDPWSS